MAKGQNHTCVYFLYDIKQINRIFGILFYLLGRNHQRLFVLEFLFWLTVTVIGWTYVGYPLLLWIATRIKNRNYRSDPIEPSITLIITAHNEEQHIGAKLDNCLGLDYLKDKLQILVASDYSNDRTHEIVESYSDRGVELMILETRGGKTAAQNKAVEQSKGEIVIFTDASTEFETSMLRKIVTYFTDKRVGCVGAELDYVSDKDTNVGRGAGAYWRYEKWIKAMESNANSLIGVSGALYAVRRSLYTPIAIDVISDFVIASEIFSKGYITVYGHGIVSKEKTLEDTKQEIKMRARVAVRSIHALVRYARMLNVFRYGFFSIQLFSHKMVRYLVPELLILLLGLHIGLIVVGSSDPLLYKILLVPHGSVYVLGLLGWFAQHAHVKIPGLHIPFYFLQVNIAALWALILYLKGERMVTWTPLR